MSSCSHHEHDWSDTDPPTFALRSTTEVPTVEDDSTQIALRKLEQSRSIVALIERQTQDRCRQRQQIRLGLHGDADKTSEVSGDSVFLTCTDFASASDDAGPGRSTLMVDDLSETPYGEEPDRVLRASKSGKIPYKSSLSQKALARLRDLKNANYEFPMHTSPRDSAELNRIDKALKSLLESPV